MLLLTVTCQITLERAEGDSCKRYKKKSLTVLLMDLGRLSSKTGPLSCSASPNSRDTMRGSRKSGRACRGERGERNESWRRMKRVRKVSSEDL